MKAILKIMDQDHEELAKLFTEFLLSVNSNSDKSLTIFSRFMQHLKKHFSWEENILFPLLEERTGLEEVLTMHRNYKIDIFYPWFDDSLDDGERAKILKLLRANKKD